ncbi:MAG: DoxX family protein [Candidatus Eremiobacteraeota bacterium]|nr:DoxX family protein [Candidatus Eremiobacteraeota bacterium]
MLAATERSWTPLQRVAFRFAFVYFGTFCLTTQILGALVPIDMPELYTLWPIRQIVFAVAARTFGLHLPLVYDGSGSGDKVFDWVFLFVSLVFAGLATIVWSLLDRKRASYGAIYRGFRFFIRFALAGQLISYGITKAIPNQMPFPGLTQLIEPFGQLSPMGVLWNSIGASPAYEIFAGCAETLAGLLLVAPRTTTLGTLLALADMTQVVMLNMTYDIPVKILSFHLLLLAIFLLAPEIGRLADVFLFERPPRVATRTALFCGKRENRIMFFGQLAIGVYLVVINVDQGISDWRTYGGGAPHSTLYGIWDVALRCVDGRPQRPGPARDDRWRRVVFDRPAFIAIQLMDDSSEYMPAKVDDRAETIALGGVGVPESIGRLRFARIDARHLKLRGTLGKHTVAIDLELVDRRRYHTVSRGFHWIQDYPYNR